MGKRLHRYTHNNGPVVAISLLLPSWLVLAASEIEGSNGLLVQSLRIMAYNTLCTGSKIPQMPSIIESVDPLFGHVKRI